MTNRVTHIICWLMLLACAAYSKPLGIDPTLSNTVVPIYAHGESQPLAVVRIQSIGRDFETKGFFRIGVLPIAVGKGVRVELLNGSRMQEALGLMGEWKLSKKEGKRFELRNLSLSLDSGGVAVLQARRARPGTVGQWELVDCVLRGGNFQMQARAAVLQLTGENAGFVTWTTRGKTQSINLLKLAQGRQCHVGKIQL